MNKVYPKRVKTNVLDKVTLELKSKALENGKLSVDSGGELRFREGKLVCTREQADKILDSNNDFVEVK